MPPATSATSTTRATNRFRRLRRRAGKSFRRDDKLTRSPVSPGYRFPSRGPLRSGGGSSRLVGISPTRGVGRVRRPRDARGAGVVVRYPVRNGRVVAVDVVVDEAVEEHLPVLIRYLLVGCPLDTDLGLLPDLLGAQLDLLARRPTEDLGVEEAV